MRIGRRALLLTGLPMIGHATPSGLDSVLRGFAAITHSRARFTERKSIAALDTALQSQGILEWKAPNTLEKRTTEPFLEVLRVDGDRLRYERPDRRVAREFALDEQPEMRALVDAIRGTLSGNADMLRAHYRIGFEVQQDGVWIISLMPESFRLRLAVQSIRIIGHGAQIMVVDTDESGSFSNMRIGPLL
jgi:hypothetical protein